MELKLRPHMQEMAVLCLFQHMYQVQSMITTFSAKLYSSPVFNNPLDNPYRAGMIPVRSFSSIDRPTADSQSKNSEHSKGR